MVLEQNFYTIRQNRKVLLQILKQTPIDKLTRIPEGFNNNIWWNIAHVVVTQQLLVYKLSNLPMLVPEELLQKYRKGTYPEGVPSQEEIARLAGLLTETIDKTEADYQEGKFTDFTEYTTSVGVTLKHVDDALTFNTFHEGLHLGVIMSLKKLV